MDSNSSAMVPRVAPWRLLVLAVLGAMGGCGTTRVTDTQRTATEQLLVSNAIDQAVSQLDVHALAGKTVYFDPQYLDGVVDRGYVVSSIRQYLLASGCLLQDDRAKAAYVVEARAGGIGTDRNSVLVGVPQMTLPTLVPGQPSQIPEIPLAKKTDQKGVAKVAVFAYNRQTGRPVMQSGTLQASSTAKDSWFLGAGPFQRGSIREGTEFAGEPLQVPQLPLRADREADDRTPAPPAVPVIQAASWSEPALLRPETGQAPGQVGSSQVKAAALSGLLAGLSAGRAPLDSAALTHFTLMQPTGNQASAPAVKPPAAAANAGGQAETQPARIVNSGTGIQADAPAEEAGAGAAALSRANPAPPAAAPGGSEPPPPPRLFHFGMTVKPEN